MPTIVRPDGAEIHYDVVGTGPVILALAPGGVSSEPGQWAGSPLPSLESLQNQFTVISMDQRYAGRSRAPLAPFSYDDALADQLAVMDAAGVDRAHVLGADFGAAWALRLAYDAPARIGAVCLLEPVGLADDSARGTYYAQFNDTIRTARADGLAGVISAAEGNGCFATNSAAGPWAQRLHDEPAFRDTLLTLGRELYIILVVDFRDGFCPPGRRFFAVNDVALERLSAPVLVIPGADAWHSPAVADAIAEAVPGAECYRTTGDPTALNERIARFFTVN